jgi:hypothetical protein
MSIKLKDQEIEAIKGFQERTNAIISDLGRIALQMSDLEDVKGKVFEAKEKLASEQNEFFKEIEEAYGKGQINIDTFEFISSETSSETSSENA